MKNCTFSPRGGTRNRFIAFCLSPASSLFVKTPCTRQDCHTVFYFGQWQYQSLLSRNVLCWAVTTSVNIVTHFSMLGSDNISHYCHTLLYVGCRILVIVVTKCFILGVTSVIVVTQCSTLGSDNISHCCHAVFYIGQWQHQLLLSHNVLWWAVTTPVIVVTQYSTLGSNNNEMSQCWLLLTSVSFIRWSTRLLL